jgi:hypothetical protein
MPFPFIFSYSFLFPFYFIFSSLLFISFSFSLLTLYFFSPLFPYPYLLLPRPHSRITPSTSPPPPLLPLLHRASTASSSTSTAPCRRIELLRPVSSPAPRIDPRRPGSSAEIPVGHGGGLCRPDAWLRREAPPPGDDGEAGGRTQGERRTGLATATTASTFFRWLRRRPLRPSPSPAASSAASLVSGTPPVTSFPRPTANLLPAPLQPPRAGMAKGGEESRELRGSWFFQLRPDCAPGSGFPRCLSRGAVSGEALPNALYIAIVVGEALLVWWLEVFFSSARMVV